VHSPIYRAFSGCYHTIRWKKLYKVLRSRSIRLHLASITPFSFNQFNIHFNNTTISTPLLHFSPPQLPSKHPLRQSKHSATFCYYQLRQQCIPSQLLRSSSSPWFATSSSLMKKRKMPPLAEEDTTESLSLSNFESFSFSNPSHFPAISFHHLSMLQFLHFSFFVLRHNTPQWHLFISVSFSHTKSSSSFFPSPIA
jgi:hypothetical protein